MQIVTVNNKDYLAELDWKVLHSVGKKDNQEELNKIVKETKLKYGIKVEYQDLLCYGLLDKKDKTPSGAALLVIANQDTLLNTNDISIYKKDWVVVEKIAEDSYWVLGTKDGIPFPGLDVVLNEEETKSRIVDLLEIEDISYFSVDPVIVDLISSITTVEELSFSQIVEKFEEDYKLDVMSLKGIPKEIIYGVLGATFFITTTYFGYDYYSKYVDEENVRKAQEQQRASQIQQDKINIEKLIQEINTQKEAINKVLNNNNGSQMLLDIYNAISNIPLKENGWDLSVVECNTDKCLIKYKKSENTFNSLILDDFKEKVKLYGNVAVVELPLTKNKIDHVIDYKNLKDKDYFVKDIVSKLQLLSNNNISFNIKPTVDYNFTVTTPLPQIEKFEVEKSNLIKGSFSLIGTDYSIINNLNEVFAYDEVVLTYLVFDVKENKWQANFDYYLHNKTGHILDKEDIPTLDPEKVALSPVASAPVGVVLPASSSIGQMPPPAK